MNTFLKKEKKIIFIRITIQYKVIILNTVILRIINNKLNNYIKIY